MKDTVPLPVPIAAPLRGLVPFPPAHVPLSLGGCNQEWNAFTYETSQYYGLDLTGLSRQYEDEQRQYYMLSSAWAELKTEQVQHTSQAHKKSRDENTRAATEERERVSMCCHADGGLVCRRVSCGNPSDHRQPRGAVPVGPQDVQLRGCERSAAHALHLPPPGLAAHLGLCRMVHHRLPRL